MTLADLPSLPRPALFARLAATPPEALAVVCVSRRVADRLLEDYAQARVAAGAAVWETPTILSADAFLQALHEAARLDLLQAGAALPIPLHPQEERLLWRLVVARSRDGLPLLRESEAARLAQEAWGLVQDYRLPFPLPASTPEVERFNDWARQYREQLAALGRVDAGAWRAALLDALAARRLPLPSTIVLAGFDEPAPPLQRLVAACADAGAELLRLALPTAAGLPLLRPAADAEQELRAAARWARQRAEEQPQARIAVVVPDLGARRGDVQRLFDEQLCPAVDAPGIHSPARPYNLTLGTPLAATGLVQTALRLLRLVHEPLPHAEASALLCAPGWGGGEAERLERARFDAWLRREGHMELALDTLIQPRAGAALAAYAQALLALRPGPRRAAPGEWIETLGALLDAAGWPGARPLDSEEFQAHQAWRECLLTLGRLDSVLGRVPFSAAVAQLREIAEATVFQPKSASARIQVMGALEAEGLDFDHLWVCGLDDERWPPPARPQPFLPLALQRERGLPQASAAQELAYARRMTARWVAAAGEVVFSWPERAEDRPLSASPLLASWKDRLQASDTAPLPASWCASQASAALETLLDADAPPPRLDEVQPGGARLFGDQARCPFRGFATHRLGARELEVPAPGLSAADRGNLVHRILEDLWTQLRAQSALLALDEGSLAARIGEAVDAALTRLMQQAPQRLRPGLRSLEERRLRRLIRDWLEQDRARLPFRVIELEGRVPGDATDADRVVEFEGLRLRLRRDRVDALDDGRQLVIDYKTGARGKAPWTDARPEEPQLLIYTLLGGPVVAMAYGRVRAGAVGYEGIAADPGLGEGLRGFQEIADTREAADWNALLGRWRGELATVAGELREGWAAVSPKHPRQSCRDCELHALCRIRETVAEAAEEDGEA